MKKKLTISGLKKKADVYFSKWIRARDGKCVRCGSTEYLQNSHFWPRARNATRYSEDNCDALCYGCHYGDRQNGWEYAKQGAYREFKIKQLGHEHYQDLYKLSNTTKSFTTSELEALISKYSL